ncbi:hypothetical protein DPEC_G00257370 [Dallia pectoralis]|uniref:Uncharacterized protein n=1 Tax=Dallia pectoralis TaxID=75939 RepID=A0ACC2FQI0_DALPE|nr:hypothetical protein DPEC_G00257370 [Dallia pectoralis]
MGRRAFEHFVKMTFYDRLEPLLCSLTEEEEKQTKRMLQMKMLQRLYVLAKVKQATGEELCSSDGVGRAHGDRGEAEGLQHRETNHLIPQGQAGFPEFKYVPYGPANEVIPYLSRHAQENKSFKKGYLREQEWLWKEVKCRLASGQIFYRPQPVP